MCRRVGAEVLDMCQICAVVKFKVSPLRAIYGDEKSVCFFPFLGIGNYFNAVLFFLTDQAPDLLGSDVSTVKFLFLFQARLTLAIRTSFSL